MASSSSRMQFFEDDDDTSESECEQLSTCCKQVSLLEKIKLAAVGNNRVSSLDCSQAHLHHSNVNSHTLTLHRFLKQLQITEKKNENIGVDIPQTWQLYTKKYKEKEIKGGLYRLKKLKEQLLKQDERHQRSKQQIMFHNAFLNASIKHICGDELAPNFLDILEENNWDKISQEVLICCPRRFGKTYATALYVAAYSMIIPKHTISIFSPSKRQSEDFLDLVKGFIREDDIGRTMIIKENVTAVWLRGEDDVDIRKIKAYPAATKTLKGVGGELLILEEAAAMSTGVFYEVVVPLIEMSNTALIAISTILGNDNFYTKLLNLKDHLNQPFFQSFVFTLMCDACRARDLDPSDCTHMLDELPRWQSQNKHKRIRSMMTQMGQSQLLNQETMGLITGADDSAFDLKSIQYLFDESLNKRIVVDKSVRHAFFAIDPNGGGNSEFAIVTCTYENGKCQIIGAEGVFASMPEHYRRVMIAHIKAVEKMIPNVVKVFVIESNLGFESVHIYNMIKSSGLKNCVCLKQNNGVPGVLTTHATKEACVKVTNEYLNQKLVQINQNFVNVQSQFSNKDKSTPQSTIEKLKLQLENYKKVTDYDVEKVFKKTRVTFSGKHNGNDDLCIAFQLNLLHKRTFFQESKYRPMW